MNEENAKERRQYKRVKTIKIGTIVHQNGNCTMSCTVVDISEAGAKLKPIDPTNVPGAFRLVIARDRAYECELVRRAQNHVAVRFS